MTRPLLWLLTLLCLTATAAPARAVPPADEPLPVMPEVRIGTLENGLTYYIRANDKPENRVLLRLAVDAGSVLEEKDQRGLAHFLEHMAFNGTTHFEANDLVDFLESIGSEFGPDLNAYTSFDETVYMLEIPTDREGLLDQGLLVLSDWATGMTLDPEEVEKERGVVLEEWRQGRGASERIRQVHWPVLFRGSRYAERLPIGKPEVVETAPASRVRDFYTAWYQPQLMAVVAVGALDVDAMEARIREVFGNIPAPGTPTPRPVHDVPPHAEVLASSATDPEMPYTHLSLSFKHPQEPVRTVGDYRRGLVTSLFSTMLNERLAEIREKPDSPFLFAGSGSGASARSVDMFRVYAMCPEGGAERALEALVTEIVRIRRHGFTGSELVRAKADYRAAFERAYNERDKTESASYAREYVGNFLDDEAIPGIEYEYRVGLQLIDDIGLDEVQAAIDRLVHEENTVILASGPETADGDGDAHGDVPDAATLLAVADRALTAEPGPYVDGVAGAGLLAGIPGPGEIVDRTHDEELGLTTLTFANGVVARLKATDFKNDQILVRARVQGGVSRADSADFVSASLSVPYVNEAGFGGFTPTEMGKLLSGKLASAGAYIGNFDQGIDGNCTPRDLETMLQLIYLVITAPNDRPEAYEVLMERFGALLENRLATPEAQFGDEVLKLNYQDHPLFQPPSPEMLERMDRETAYRFFRDTMSDVSGYRFYFVGAFNPDDVEPLLARYLGALPVREGTVRAFRDPGVRFPAGVHRRTVHAGTEPKSRVLITWPALTGLEEMEMFRLRGAAHVLEIRLREALREELGGTYSVSVGVNTPIPFPGYGTTSVSFGCAPGNAEAMIERVFAEVDTFLAEGPTEEEAAKVREIRIRSLEENLERNSYWLSSFVTLDLLGWDPHRINARRERIDTLTPAALKETVSRYFPTDNHTVVMLMPEEGGGD